MSHEATKERAWTMSQVLRAGILAESRTSSAAAKDIEYHYQWSGISLGEFLRATGGRSKARFTLLHIDILYVVFNGAELICLCEGNDSRLSRLMIV
jgi:hypothetical protein